MASCVAAAVAIAVMLNRDASFIDSHQYYDIPAIIELAYKKGVEFIENEEHVRNIFRYTYTNITLLLRY